MPKYHIPRDLWPEAGPHHRVEDLAFEMVPRFDNAWMIREERMLMAYRTGIPDIFECLTAAAEGLEQPYLSIGYDNVHEEFFQVVGWRKPTDVELAFHTEASDLLGVKERQQLAELAAKHPAFAQQLAANIKEPS